MMAKIKRDDMVLIIAGDDKGKTGKVLKVLPKESKVIVEGCNIVKKAIKPSDNNPKGGFISKEKPIHISNVKKS
ncbi:50S ribosomal protein L24 [Helicobacter sp. MIT 99-5507]|nr:50S ribosomal protein L24 [Helicobacter sp. MIT 99-5507]